jgi:SAM-dependent methyltransferase
MIWLWMKAKRRLDHLRKRLLAHPVPLYPNFGFGRGWPIDRHYIEGFLEGRASDIRGDVLEAGISPNYTAKFGGDRVVRSHIMYPMEGRPGGTLVANLETGEGLPRAAFDCAILTQVFQFIFDMPSAVRNAHASLKEGGVLLATFAGISQIAQEDMNIWGEYWRITDAGARRLFGSVFGESHVEVEVFGNCLAACAFLNGMVISDLAPEDLDYRDPEFQLIIAVRAVKRSASAAGTSFNTSAGS